jgi:hypothetical protein
VPSGKKIEESDTVQMASVQLLLTLLDAARMYFSHETTIQYTRKFCGRIYRNTCKSPKSSLSLLFVESHPPVNCAEWKKHQVYELMCKKFSLLSSTTIFDRPLIRQQNAEESQNSWSKNNSKRDPSIQKVTVIEMLMNERTIDYH